MSCLQSAAQRTDSLPAGYYSDFFYKNYSFYHQDAILQRLSDTRYYNIVGLTYSRESGNLHLSQVPGKNTGYYFATEGVRQLGRFKISGRFRYTVSTLDSLGNTLSYAPQQPDLTAYYFYAQKKGRWSYGEYDMNAIVSYAFFKEKLWLSGGIDYNASNGDRNSDPRPSKKTFYLQASPSIGWRFSPKHIVAAGYTFGFNRNRVSVDYKNTAYQVNRTLYPEYIVNRIMGYGNLDPQLTLQDMREYADNYGFNGVYDGHFCFGQVTVSGYWKRNDHQFRRDAATANATRFRYGEQYDDLIGLNALWQKTTNIRQYRIQASYSSLQTFNIDSILAATNYVAAWDRVEVEPAVVFLKKGKPKHELALNGHYGDLYRVDGNISAHVENRWVDVQLKGAHYMYLEKDNLVKISWGAGYTFPLASSYIRIPATEETIFTANVAYPDFAFYNTAKYQGKAGIAWYGKYKKQTFFVRGALQYQQTAKTSVVHNTIYHGAKASRKWAEFSAWIVL